MCTAAVQDDGDGSPVTQNGNLFLFLISACISSSSPTFLGLRQGSIVISVMLLVAGLLDASVAERLCQVAEWLHSLVRRSHEGSDVAGRLASLALAGGSIGLRWCGASGDSQSATTNTPV